MKGSPIARPLVCNRGSFALGWKRNIGISLPVVLLFAADLPSAEGLAGGGTSTLANWLGYARLSSWKICAGSTSYSSASRCSF